MFDDEVHHATARETNRIQTLHPAHVDHVPLFDEGRRRFKGVGIQVRHRVEDMVQNHPERRGSDLGDRSLVSMFLRAVVGGNSRKSVASISNGIHRVSDGGN